MESKKDVVYTVTGYVFAALITVMLLFLSPCQNFEQNGGTVILKYFSYSHEELREESNRNAAPDFCTPSNPMWFITFLPLICSAPCVSKTAAELKGSYSFRLCREGGFSKYWNKTFFEYVLSGAGSVLAGYLVFCAAIYLHFPKNSEYLSEYRPDSLEEVYFSQVPLHSQLGALFNSQNEYLYVLNAAVSVFLFSAAISALCLLLYLLTQSKYKALGLPMAVMFAVDDGFYGLYLKGNHLAGLLCPGNMVLRSQIVFNDFGRVELGLENYERLGLIYFPIVLGITAALYLFGRKAFGKRVMN